MIAPPPKSHLGPMLSAKRCRPIDRAQELDLLHKAQAGDQRALHRLVLANMKFVAAVARKYQHHGLTPEDLVQEGAMGLQLAIQKFNPASPNRLISYAVWWIRQRILLALAEHGRTIKLPARFGELGSKAEAARRRLEQQHARTPSMEEVAAAISMATDRLAPALALLSPSESLDHPIGEDSTRIDLMACADDLDETLDASLQHRNVRGLLRHLDPVDREILVRYYGLQTGEHETLAEIADRMGLSRERIRQRQEKALSHLRPKARNMKLLAHIPA